MISFLWAEAKNGVIGKDGKLPWKIKEEMQHFTNYTKNKTVLMGRNTWDGLYLKPLPNRKNIVITSRPMEHYENTLVTSDLQQAIQPYLNSNEELVVIGGQQIFNSLINQVDKLVISVINQEYDGDVSAPSWNQDDFQLIDQTDYPEFKILTYQRKVKKDLD